MGAGGSSHEAVPLVPDQEGTDMTMHALADDREHCVCGQEFPDAGWIAQLGDLDRAVWDVTYQMYAELVPPHVAERLRAALIKEMA